MKYILLSLVIIPFLPTFVSAQETGNNIRIEPVILSACGAQTIEIKGFARTSHVNLAGRYSEISVTHGDVEIYNERRTVSKDDIFVIKRPFTVGNHTVTGYVTEKSWRNESINDRKATYGTSFTVKPCDTSSVIEEDIVLGSEQENRAELEALYKQLLELLALYQELLKKKIELGL